MPLQKPASPGYPLQVRTRSCLPRLRGFRFYPFRAGAWEGDLVLLKALRVPKQWCHQPTMSRSSFHPFENIANDMERDRVRAD